MIITEMFKFSVLIEKMLEKEGLLLGVQGLVGGGVTSRVEIIKGPFLPSKHAVIPLSSANNTIRVRCTTHEKLRDQKWEGSEREVGIEPAIHARLLRFQEF